MNLTQVLDFDNCRWSAEKGAIVYNLIKDELLQHQAAYKCKPSVIEIIVGLHTYEYLSDYLIAKSYTNISDFEMFGIKLNVTVNWNYDLNSIFILAHK